MVFFEMLDSFSFALENNNKTSVTLPLLSFTVFSSSPSEFLLSNYCQSKALICYRHAVMKYMSHCVVI